MNKQTPAAAFEIELTVFARLPLKLGPFYTRTSQDEQGPRIVFDGFPLSRIELGKFDRHRVAASSYSGIVNTIPACKRIGSSPITARLAS